MSEVIVAKAGGTSNATPEAVEQSLAWAEQSDIFVVSAPGKLDGESFAEQKVTDQLIQAHNHYHTTGVVPEDMIDGVVSRYDAIIGGLDTSLPGKWLDGIGPRMVEAARQSSDAASMLGEQLQAEVYHSMGFQVLDPGRASSDLGSNHGAWQDWLSEIFEPGSRYVLPGNVTKLAGKLATFGRGGSDISGGFAAYGVGADLHLNLTDGCAMSADPRLIDRPRLRHIDHLLYDEARELGRNGTGLVHPAAMVPLMKGRIPTEIRSTFDRDQQPTHLDTDHARAADRAGQVAALSLMREVIIFEVRQPGMAEATGRLADFEASLAHNGVSLIDSQGDGVDGQKYFVSKDDLSATHDALQAEREKDDSIVIEASEPVDLITLVGYDMRIRYFDHIVDIALNSGIDPKQWQNNGHDLSYGRHSLRISVDADKSAAVLDRLHHHYLEQ